jgi:hypothetical protein
MGQGCCEMKITVVARLPAKGDMDVNACQIISALCPVIE